MSCQRPLREAWSGKNERKGCTYLLRILLNENFVRLTFATALSSSMTAGGDVNVKGYSLRFEISDLR